MNKMHVPTFVSVMALSPATIARRSALHMPVLQALKDGKSPVAGVDEAGAGALAGPVVAAAVMLRPSIQKLDLDGLDDSKRLSRLQRERVFKLLMSHSDLTCTYSIVSAAKIDEINILNARLLAMSQAINALVNPSPRLVLVDGNLPLPDIEHECEQQTVVGGDACVSLIAAASVIAKVTRDRIMFEEALRFPQYAFDTHVGYGTKVHLQTLRQHGPCSIHRTSYKPVRAAQEDATSR